MLRSPNKFVRAAMGERAVAFITFRVSRRREHRQQSEGRQPAKFVGLDGPTPGDRGQSRYGGKCRRHADEHRQPAAQERLVRSGEHEGQHRENAGTDVDLVGRESCWL